MQKNHGKSTPLTPTGVEPFRLNGRPGVNRLFPNLGGLTSGKKDPFRKRVPKKSKERKKKKGLSIAVSRLIKEEGKKVSQTSPEGWGITTCIR